MLNANKVPVSIGHVSKTNVTILVLPVFMIKMHNTRIRRLSTSCSHFPTLDQPSFIHIFISFESKPIRWEQKTSQACPPNAQCHQLINEQHRFVCLCKPQFTGKNCIIRDKRCVTEYCAQTSLCLHNYRLLIRGNLFPYNRCALTRYGNRCDILPEIILTKQTVSFSSSTCSWSLFTYSESECKPDRRNNENLCLNSLQTHPFNVKHRVIQIWRKSIRKVIFKEIS